MLRILPAALLLTVVGSIAFSLSRSDFERVVDFSVTLKDLAAVAEGRQSLPSTKIVILNGTVSDVNVVNKEGASFHVRIELITGEWVGTEDVKSYSCYVDFAGPQYFTIFPARQPRTAAPGTVVNNTRVIVVGRPLGVTTTPLGEKRVLVEGMLIRTVE